MFHMHEGGGVIDEYGTTRILLGRIFFSISMWEATFSSTDALIHGDTVTWLKVVSSDSHLSLGLEVGDRSVRSSSMLLCQLTRTTLRFGA